MKHFAVILSALCVLFATSCTPKESEPAAVRQNVNIDRGWQFTLTDYEGSIYTPTGIADDVALASADYDDSAWRTLNVPHDWAIEGEFSADNPSGTGGGALPGGIGWYRRHFTLDELGVSADKVYSVLFGGVYMNSSVYLNGHLLGTRPYGYISFEYDLTPYINKEGDNVLAVRVDNSDQPNSRWYSGCGIFRSVYLTATDAVHIVPWDTHVQPHAPARHAYRYLDADSLTLAVANTSAEDVQGWKAVLAIADADGCEVFADTLPLAVDADSSAAVGFRFAIQHPIRWSLDNPYLYTAHTAIVNAEGGVVDDYSLRFGIRDFRFDAEHGFFLNGQHVKLNGVCMHHDLGCLGSAVNRRAIERQLQIMKGMGVNAFRCSHNPPSEELLELCDEMGIVVMDEAFDMWRRRKTQRDYARFFDEWHERDLGDLIRRDRNHPCIVMWSIGNEILEQWHSADTDGLTLEDANLILNQGHDVVEVQEGENHFNCILTRHLADIVHRYDTSRPITAGCNETNPGNLLFRSGAIDIIGFNYHEYQFEQAPHWYPGKPFIVSESVSSLHTRGHYLMPSDQDHAWPSRWDRPHEDSTFMCSAYDNCHAPWSSTHEKNLQYVKNLDYIAGQFIWTGFDYLGEPTPYGWPARSSYFGIVDLAGFPKDAYWLYQSEWTDDDVLHILPHWTWNVEGVAESQLADDGTIDVWAYYNHADEAELFINGVSQGIAHKDGKFHAMWRVHYEPGTIKVVTRRLGEVVCEQTLTTVGEPYAVRLTADRSRLAADGRDLSFVTVDIVDRDGNVCPWADDLVDFSVSGNAFIAGVDNGLQTSMESFKAPFRKAFHGKCLVVLQNDGNVGGATLKATAKGLKGDKVRVSFK